MRKEAFFFMDDSIWSLREIAVEKPKSIFDQRYFKLIKECHDTWGLTLQMNLFYQTDSENCDFYFDLSQMPDTYKEEFKQNSDWLKFAFHAYKEFPDYPYINADYDQVVREYNMVVNEIKRFAGEECLSEAICPHWLPISKDGCRALADCGVKFITPSSGVALPVDRSKFDASQLLTISDNPKPEIRMYHRKPTDGFMSFCSYNHVSSEEWKYMGFKNNSLPDKELATRYKRFGGGPCLNLNTVENIEKRLIEIDKNGAEFIGTCNHEQYFYDFYFNYQPDMPQKLRTFAKTLHDLGYTFITADDFK